MKTRLWFSLSLALAVLAFLVGDAAAAIPSKIGVLSMTPAQRRLTARPPLTLSDTRVSNTTQLTMKVHVFTGELTQALSGTFGIRETPADLNAGKLIFPVGPTNFTMKPGDSVALHLRWALVPRGKHAVYMGLLVQ